LCQEPKRITFGINNPFFFPGGVTLRTGCQFWAANEAGSIKEPMYINSCTIIRRFIEVWKYMKIP
jgi:hypothetical protein